VTVEGKPDKREDVGRGPSVLAVRRKEGLTEVKKKGAGETETTFLRGGKTRNALESKKKKTFLPKDVSVASMAGRWVRKK